MSHFLLVFHYSCISYASRITNSLIDFHVTGNLSLYQNPFELGSNGLSWAGLGLAEGTRCTFYPIPVRSHRLPSSLITMHNTSTSAALTIVPCSFPPSSCTDRHKRTTLLTVREIKHYYTPHTPVYTYTPHTSHITGTIQKHSLHLTPYMLYAQA